MNKIRIKKYQDMQTRPWFGWHSGCELGEHVWTGWSSDSHEGVVRWAAGHIMAHRDLTRRAS